MVWEVHGLFWEVMFTGSLAWKEPDNRRSHKIVLNGPHFIFVRDAKLVGKAIVCEDLSKFHV